MKEQQLPKIVSISLSTWRQDSGIHTQTDLFKFWEKDRLAQIYTKSDYPDTPVCDKFFRIAENKVIKSVYKRIPVGERVENRVQSTAEDKKAEEEEKKLYAKAHKKKSWFMTLMRELVWSLGRWKTKALDTFIQEESPDVYFVPIYPVVYMGKLQLHILKKHPRPYVCYLADDNYSYKTCGKNIFAYIHRFFLRKVVKKLAKNCNQMFTITQTEAEDTDKLFGTHSVVLTKGIDYSNLAYQEKPVHTPLKMVYTGKMVIGRDQTLAAMAEAVKRINADGEKISFEIYSPDVPNKKTLLRMQDGAKLMGCVHKDKVQEIQEAADVVVFVEGLEKKDRLIARLSFSTKLTDYFRSGKCIFAVGDKRIAPIEYLKDNDCAVIACEYEEIEERLRELLDRPNMVLEYGKKAFDCGKRNHDETHIKQVFIETFKKAVDDKK